MQYSFRYHAVSYTTNPSIELQLKFISSKLISGAVAVRFAQFGSGFGIIHLDDVHCDGSELRLSDCTHLGVGNHNCVPSEDAGVICSSGYQDTVFSANISALHFS